MPEPDVALAKAKLARQLAGIVEERGLTQKQAGAILGIDQPKVSALLRGRLRDFSTDRLMQLLTRFDLDVDISVSRKKPDVPIARISVFSTVEPIATTPASAVKKEGVQFS